MRWKTKDKTYGIQKPTQHFVRGIFTLFTSLCLTRPLSLNETFYIHWFVLSWKHVLFFTCSSPLFDHLFIRSIHGLPCLYPSHFSATLLSDRTSTLLGIQHFSISLNKHPRSKKRPPPNKCPPSGAPSKPPLPPPPPFSSLISSTGRNTKKNTFFCHFIYNLSSFNRSGIRTGDLWATPSI